MRVAVLSYERVLDCSIVTWSTTRRLLSKIVVETVLVSAAWAGIAIIQSKHKNNVNILFIIFPP